jgi:23S rRNA (pseudouridine1915-N3)-methyltransferase
MPRIRVIVVGQTRSGFVQEGQAFYLERLRHYIPVEWVVTKAAVIGKNVTHQSVREQEARHIRKKLRDREYVITMDRKGKTYDSLEFASHVERLMTEQERLVFVIGGAVGLADDLLKASQEVLSLSRFTFTHEMTRLFLLEQLYRAFTIMRGESYHK